MRRTELTKKTARNKGLAALGAASVTVLLCFMFTTFWFAVIGAPVTGVLAYRWFKYRAKWGLRF